MLSRRLSYLVLYMKGYILGVIGYQYDKKLIERLKSTRNDDYRITEEKLEFIKEIANKAYDDVSYGDAYRDIEDIEDLTAILRAFDPVQLYIITGRDWYALFVEHTGYVYFIDFASGSKKCTDILWLYSEVSHLFEKKAVKMKSREITSYRLIKSLEKSGRVRICKDKLFYDEEANHFVTLRLIR